MNRFTVYPVAVEGHLDEPLSRWLWLVKWLLIIPHLVVLVFLGVAALLMTIVAWFCILITGRYNRPIFDLVMGFNRWTMRVIAYVALMRDEYPPFRLDPGETEPEVGTTVAPMPPGAPAPAP
jgi:hypothetical protein